MRNLAPASGAKPETAKENPPFLLNRLAFYVTAIVTETNCFCLNVPSSMNPYSLSTPKVRLCFERKKIIASISAKGTFAVGQNSIIQGHLFPFQHMTKVSIVI